MTRRLRALASAAATLASPSAVGEPVLRVAQPSAAHAAALLASGTPAVLVDALSGWPALELTPALLAERFGDTVVPVELSRAKADYRHAQHPHPAACVHTPPSAFMRVANVGLTRRDSRRRSNFVAGEEMTLRSFVRAYLGGVARSSTTWQGYLAQHALFDRTPELHALAPPPPLVPPSATRNIWLGPAGIATPLHCDPYHNLFCQLHGRKRVRLYAASQAAQLFPFAPPAPRVLHNTSRVDDPDAPAAAFAGFERVPFWRADLAPGECLLLPRGVWHHVRAVDDALSISFWWL